MTAKVREIADKYTDGKQPWMERNEVEALAAHVLASTEPLGEERLQMAKNREEHLQKTLDTAIASIGICAESRDVLKHEVRDLRTQLQTAEQHQKESDERISNQREEIKRQASELATLHRRIQIYCNWKYESDDKIKSIQQLADERGREVERLATPAATPPAQPDSVVKDYLTT